MKKVFIVLLLLIAVSNFLNAQWWWEEDEECSGLQLPDSYKGKDPCEAAKNMQEKVEKAQKKIDSTNLKLEEFKKQKTELETELKSYQEQIKKIEEQEYQDIYKMGKDQKDQLLNEVKQCRDLAQDLYLQAAHNSFLARTEYQMKSKAAEKRTRRVQKLKAVKESRITRIEKNKKEVLAIKEKIATFEAQKKDLVKYTNGLDKESATWEKSKNKSAKGDCKAAVENHIEGINTQKKNADELMNGLEQDIMNYQKKIETFEQDSGAAQQISDRIDNYFSEVETALDDEKRAKAISMLAELKDLASREKIKELQDPLREYATKYAAEWFLGADPDILESNNWEMILIEMTPVLKGNRLNYLANQYEQMANGIDEGVREYIDIHKSITRNPELIDLYAKEADLKKKITPIDNDIALASNISSNLRLGFDEVTKLNDELKKNCEDYKTHKPLTKLTKDERQNLLNCLCTWCGTLGGYYAGPGPGGPCKCSGPWSQWRDQFNPDPKARQSCFKAYGVFYEEKEVNRYLKKPK